MIVNNTLVNFYRSGNNLYTLEVRDLDNASDEYFATKKFQYSSDVEADKGSLVLFDNTIFIEPHNKQLNLIDGEWRLNDFVSTTPTVNNILSSDLVFDGLPETGFINVRSGTLPITSKSAFLEVINLTPQKQSFVFTFVGIRKVIKIDYSPENDLLNGGFINYIVEQFNSTENSPVTAIQFNNFIRLTTKQEFSVVELRRVIIREGFSDDEKILNPTFSETSYDFTPNFPQTTNVTLQIGTHSRNFTIDASDNVIDKFVQSINTITEITDKFNISVNNTRINFTRKVNGDFGGKVISVQWSPEQNLVVETKNISGGVDNITGIGSGLKQRTDYWYCARYRYFDGHVTKTCYPEYFRTTNESRAIQLEITTTKDIDGRFCLIEIFRREEDGEFFLIDTVRPDESTLTYVDAGKPNLQLLDEQNYVWTTKHKSQEIVRDRYVKANVEFPQRELLGSFTINPTLADEQARYIVPPNVNVTVLAQGRNNDGLETFFKEVGNFRNESKELSLTAIIDKIPEDTKEIAYYAKYQNLVSDINITFRTPEIYNQNIQSIASREEEIKDNPINPHVFFAWKRIVAMPVGDNYFTITYDNEWAKWPVSFTGPQSITELYGSIPIQTDFEFNTSQINNADDAPDLIKVNSFGKDLTYIKKFSKKTSKMNSPILVYELAILDGLLSAINNVKVSVELTQILADTNISSLVSELELRNLREESFNITEKQIPNQEFLISFTDPDEDTAENPAPTSRTIRQEELYYRNSRVYLTFSADSILTKINDPQINNRNFGTSINQQFIETIPFNSGINDASLEFKLNGLIEFDFLGELVSDTISDDIIEYTNQYGLQSLIPLNTEIDAAIYLGKESNLQPELFLKTNIETKLPVTGFVKERLNKFAFYSIQPSTIFRTPTFVEDLQQIKTIYPNQIVWSEPFIRGTNSSGIRNITFNNFLNVNPDYGQIIDIHYINNFLLVFTNYAVGVVNVGETLTQQPSGETVVDSSRFLTGQSWVLTNLVKIQRESIRRYENMLFFSDSKDVYMFNGQFSNISNGAITLANEPHIGAIDSENKEYRITDQKQTWAYSIEIAEWFGPYTYKDQANVNYRNQLLSINNFDLVKHNETNVFHFTPYDTIIESISNDLGDPSTDKIFRKFYFDIDGEEGTEFEYYKQPGTNVTKKVADSARRNENWHIGVDSNNQNSKRMFWKFKTRAEGFVLKMLAFMYNPRKRR